MAAQQPDSQMGSPRSGNKIVLGALAVAIVMAVVIASIGSGLLPFLGTSTLSSSSSPSSSSTSSVGAIRTTSTSSLSSAIALCSPLAPAQLLANSKTINGSAQRAPNYDEQLLLGFEQNFTSSISYNVTLRSQNDSFGFGPAYLLNGLTDSGYWYQVGVAWNLGLASGSQYAQGFRFVYEVWNTNTGRSIFPAVGGTLPARFLAGDGDMVLLTLNMTQDGQISMTAHEWNTSATATAAYDGFGASQFLGFKNRVSSYPTSLLTEWYHVVPYLCSEERVVYSSDVLSLSSAWMRINEWNLTGVSASQRFNSSAAGQCCVFMTPYQGVGFQEPDTFHSLTTNGTTIYANAHKFITP
jgi:hypothetical protein